MGDELRAGLEDSLVNQVPVRKGTGERNTEMKLTVTERDVTKNQRRNGARWDGVAKREGRWRLQGRLSSMTITGRRDQGGLLFCPLGIPPLPRDTASSALPCPFRPQKTAHGPPTSGAGMTT